MTDRRIEDLPEYLEIAERARVETDISDHLLTIFREGLAARPKLVVELGVRSGESTFVLERVAKLTGATLVSVDLEDCSRVSPWERWHFVRSDDVAFAAEFGVWCQARGIEPQIDVLFVDTSHEHEHTRREIAAWLPYLSPGGRAVFHDTNLKRTVRRRDGRVLPCPFEQRGVTRALEEFLGGPLDETRDFTLARGGWTVRHDSCCHGLTVLEKTMSEAQEHANVTSSSSRPAAIVFCQRLDNESFCESICREIGAFYDVRPCGPGWPARDLRDVDMTGAAFYLELDPASGSFDRPTGLAQLSVPKFAWLIDTHKKPAFHAEIARDMDLTFFAHKVWGHVFRTPSAWLPLHANQEIFRPVECERDLDLVFVGSQEWRADPLRRIAEKHGLKIHVVCTTGPREKSETAALYARAKLVFNRHCANDLNFRVFEAMTAGRVVLTDAQWNGQYELFEDGRHYVLYKDERDLERQILHYLQDDVARARIESEGAALAAREHTTRARVRQLVASVEGVLHQRAAPRLERGPARHATLSPAHTSPATPRAKRRWLFFVGDKPATVERRTHAERLAWGLAGAGHDVVVARAQRAALPHKSSRVTGAPLVIELDLGLLPEALSAPNRILAESAALHAGFDRVAREHGPFDVLVGEGAAGGLAAEPVAARLGRPFVLALEACEVAKRGNRLTREQLNVAELEHWFAERATAVVVPTREVADAAKSFYKSQRVHVIAAPSPRLVTPSEPGRLARRLGVEPGNYVVVLAPHEGEREKAALLRGETARVHVLVANDVRVRDRTGETRLLSRTPPRGTSLGALLAASAAVVGLDPTDQRLDEARTLACRIALADSAAAVAQGGGFLEAAASATHATRVAPAPLADDGDLSVLEALLAKAPGSAPAAERKAVELALVQ